MTETETRKTLLISGKSMPIVGLGTSRLSDPKSTVSEALSLGYRHIDTAEMYGNEIAIGEALSESDLERGDLFVTTKLWRDNLGYETALEHLDASLERLGLDYVDLYLIHWPGHEIWNEMRKEAWHAFEEIYKGGKAKSIGVSNYMLQHLHELESYATVAPMVNQIELHPFLYTARKEILTYCKEHDIVITSYSPLMRGSGLYSHFFERIAEKYDCSTPQVLLAWNIQHGNVVIPRASKEAHLKENLALFDFELDEDDMERLDSLG